MEPAFVNQYTITLELLKEWTKLPVGRSAIQGRRKWLILRTFGVAISIVIIAFGAIMQEFYAALLGVAFFVLYFLQLVVVPGRALKKRYDMRIKSLNNQPWVRKTLFSDKIAVEEGSSTTNFEYAEIVKVTEDEQYFNLFLNEDMALRIRRDSFIHGSSEGFRDFINAAISNQAN